MSLFPFFPSCSTACFPALLLTRSLPRPLPPAKLRPPPPPPPPPSPTWRFFFLRICPTLDYLFIMFFFFCTLFFTPPLSSHWRSVYTLFLFFFSRTLSTPPPYVLPPHVWMRICLLFFYFLIIFFTGSSFSFSLFFLLPDFILFLFSCFLFVWVDLFLRPVPGELSLAEFFQAFLLSLSQRVLSIVSSFALESLPIRGKCSLPFQFIKCQWYRDCIRPLNIQPRFLVKDWHAGKHL